MGKYRGGRWTGPEPKCQLWRWGGYNLRLVKSQREAIKIVQAACDAGITFMDNAWEYHDGLSEEIMGKALAGPAAQRFSDD